MVGVNLFKCFCILLVLGLADAVAKFDVSKLNVSALFKPFISHVQRAQTFWDPDFCNDWQDGDAFPHPDSCQEYLICWQGELWEGICDPGLLFDPWDAYCDDADNVVCLDDQWPEDNDCPPFGSTEIRFLPSYYCDEFYICINGEPVLWFCRPGQHWNAVKEFCDDPENAGCDPDAGNPAPIELPDCPPGVVGSFPHPHNCNWFIHCNNGNRLIQQCQHLHHFDVDEGRCIFHNSARCIKHARA